jgi:hypothetical protein
MTCCDQNTDTKRKEETLVKTNIMQVSVYIKERIESKVTKDMSKREPQKIHYHTQMNQSKEDNSGPKTTAHCPPQDP